jgi:hypothetical protein
MPSTIKPSQGYLIFPACGHKPPFADHFGKPGVALML